MCRGAQNKTTAGHRLYYKDNAEIQKGKIVSHSDAKGIKAVLVRCIARTAETKLDTVH